MRGRRAERPVAAAIVRLAALSPLDAEAATALEAAVNRPRTYRARREILTEGQEIGETLLILNGWAARVRLLEDGRRQIMNFLLPGDLIGFCDHDHALASSTVSAVTEVDTGVAPSPRLSPSLAQVYARSRAREEAYLLAQITRLGRLNAQERIADLLLELLERLELAGLAVHGNFTMPLTQEVIADALGLTSVHVNRTLQALRREGSVEWRGREVTIPNPAALARSIGRSAIRVARD